MIRKLTEESIDKLYHIRGKLILCDNTPEYMVELLQWVIGDSIDCNDVAVKLPNRKVLTTMKRWEKWLKKYPNSVLEEKISKNRLQQLLRERKVLELGWINDGEITE